MAHRVLTVERSPLARNVYSMILSKLDEIELVSVEVQETAAEIRIRAKGADLIIIGQDAIGDRKKEFYQMLKGASREGPVPCVVFVRRGSKPAWEDFAKLKGVVLIEKPFFPDDFLDAVRRIWGAK